MTLAIILLALVVAVCWLHRHERDTYVSAQWLAEQRYRTQAAGREQPVVRQWPIRKMSNEIGWWNTQKLRKRA